MIMDATNTSLRRRSLLAGAGAVGLAAIAPSTAKAQDAPLRFGLAMPLTGSQATYGQDQVKAAQWAVDEINKAGGINGKKLAAIVLDTQADAQTGIQAATRLASVEKVAAFVTAWSDVVKAVAPISNDSKVVELSVGANSAEIAKLGDYVYTTFPLADVDITAVARYAARRCSTSTTRPARWRLKSTATCSPNRAAPWLPMKPTTPRPLTGPARC